MTSTIVLLGGSGLGPWAWQRVTSILTAQGLVTLTPQLRATGDDRTPPAQVSLADWIDDVTNFVADHAPHDLTLVAHSFAGYVVAGVLARDATRVRTAVFLDAVLPEPGRSWFDVMGTGVQDMMSALASDGAIPWYTRAQLDQFHPGHGITDEDYAWMQPQLTAQPIATYTEPAISEPLGRVGRGGPQLAYVRCLRTTPPVADIGEHSTNWTFRTLDTGHWPMITDPAATAKVIQELARP